MSGIIGVSPNMKSGVVGDYPDKPAFYVYGGVGNTSVGNQSVFPWASIHTNVGGHFDLSQNRFIVPQKGAYWFCLKAYFYGGDNSTQNSLKLLRENSGGVAQEHPAFAYQPSEILYNDDTMYVQAVFNCWKGDKVCALNNDSAEDYYFSALSHSTFQGFLIG